MCEKGENMRVFLRCRPLIDVKCNSSQQPLLKIDDNKITVQAKIAEKCCNKCFVFDKVFNEDTKQEEIYKTAIQPLVEEMLKGFHCTMFAYGQTGTGKTYTIEGERSNKSIPWWEDPIAGAIPRVLFHIFKELSLCNNEYSVRMSAVQIYNEELFDLLNESASIKLKMFEDPSKGSVWIQGLIETPVHTVEEAYKVMENIMLKRQTTSTLTHSSSSRSHSIVTISVSTKTNVKVELFRNGKLTMVDLAGSENIGRSGAVNKQAREAGSINQSLLTLNRVTMALIRKAVHIPYRESKLTRMLQNSIGGNCKTALIATISPARNQIEETLSTLEYASLAKSVVNYPKSNQKINKTASLKEYTKEITQLQRDLFATLEKCGVNVSEDNYNLLESELAARRKEVKEKTAEIEEMEEKAEQANFQTINTQNELLEKSLAITQHRNDTERIHQQLTKTTKKLHKTKKNVERATLELEEAKYLALQREKKGKKITYEIKQLSEVLTDTSSDADLLHSAIERKTEIEKSNKICLEKISLHCIEKISSLKNCIDDMCHKQMSFYKQLEAGMDAVIDIHKKRSRSISTGMNNFLYSYSNYKPYFENYCKEQELVSRNLQEDQIRICQEKPIPQQVLRVVENNNRLSNEILKDVMYNHNLIVNTNKVLNSNLDHFKTSVECAANAQEKILEEIKISVKNHEELQKRNLSIASSFASFTNSSFQNFTDTWSNKYKNIVQMNSHSGTIITNHHLCCSYFSELSRKLLKVKENFENNKISLISEAEKLKDSSNNLKTNFNSYLCLHLQNKENEIKKAADISKVAHMEKEKFPIQLMNIVNIIEAPLHESSQDLKHSLDDHCDKISLNLRNAHSVLNEIHTVASSVSKDYHNHIAKNKEQQISCFAKNNRILQDITQSCLLQSKELMKTIEQSKNDVEDYFANFHVCKPTGATPVRKIYNYTEAIDLP